MTNTGLLNLIKENKLTHLLYDTKNIPCEYYNEQRLITKKRGNHDFLNVISLNISSLPKHIGELLCFLGALETHIDVIVLTEIGARNIPMCQDLIKGYTFNYVIPTTNPKGG